MEHLNHSKHTLATFASKRNIDLLLGRMEARYRAGRTYQHHARGGTNGDDVSVDIHPSERMQEMDGGEADVEVVCLDGWRVARDGSRQFPSCGRDEQEKGAAVRFAQ
jgi:hypothetical protein